MVSRRKSTTPVGPRPKSSSVSVDADAAPGGGVAPSMADLRMLEALLFAAAGPLDGATLARHLPLGANVPALIAQLQQDYALRGVNLVRINASYAFRTAPDLGHVLEQHATEERRLSRAAMETLAIIAYHQPVTRAEIEEIRGVATSAGTLDVLMETGWVKPRGRRRAPGRPLTYGTSEKFLDHFSLESLKDLPGLSDLKGAGLLDANLPPDFAMPQPKDLAALMPDELPLADVESFDAAQGEMVLEADPPEDATGSGEADDDEPSGGRSGV